MVTGNYQKKKSHECYCIEFPLVERLNRERVDKGLMKTNIIRFCLWPGTRLTDVSQIPKNEKTTEFIFIRCYK